MSKSRSVVLVSPVPPPYGGMTLQVQALRDCLLSEGIAVDVIATNPLLPTALSHVRGLRTVGQSLIFLLRLLRKLPQVQVVHVLAASYLYFFLRVTPAVLLGRILGARVVVNYRGGAAAEFFRRWGWFARPVLRLAHVITVPSGFLEKLFRQNGFAAEVVSNLVDVNRFQFRERNEIRPHLIVTRNLEPMYNVKMALEAFAKVKRGWPDARLEVIGTGTQEDELKEWVRQNGLQDVYFHGAVRNEEIPSYLARADILINPSNVDNMPINLLEAFAAGVPVVTTSAGGIPNLVGDEKAALLVEPGNSAQMAEKIEAILSDPDRATRLTVYARDLCKSFTWEAIRERLLTVYYPQNQAVRRA